jgi:hypothetical protein
MSKRVLDSINGALQNFKKKKRFDLYSIWGKYELQT